MPFMLTHTLSAERITPFQGRIVFMCVRFPLSSYWMMNMKLPPHPGASRQCTYRACAGRCGSGTLMSVYFSVK